MTMYTITEKQNTQSTRKGVVLSCKNLTSAKRVASRMKMFKGTVLTITDQSGCILSTKVGSRWEDSAFITGF